MYAGRKQQRFPLARQGRREAERSPHGKFGRDLLVSSHAGTRLPIAACSWPGHRALPLCPLPEDRVAGFTFPDTHPFPKEVKNSGRLVVPAVRYPVMLPTVALPTSGLRVEAMLPLSLSAPLFSPLLCHFDKSLSRGLKTPEKRRMINENIDGESAGAG